jgi:hypothetical protein
MISQSWMFWLVSRMLSSAIVLLLPEFLAAERLS